MTGAAGRTGKMRWCSAMPAMAAGTSTASLLLSRPSPSASGSAPRVLSATFPELPTAAAARTVKSNQLDVVMPSCISSGSVLLPLDLVSVDSLKGGQALSQSALVATRVEDIAARKG